MTSSGDLAARRRAFALVLHPLEATALAVSAWAWLAPFPTLAGFGVATGLGAAGAVLRRHWPSGACWAAVGAWLLAAAPWPHI